MSVTCGAVCYVKALGLHDITVELLVLRQHLCLVHVFVIWSTSLSSPHAWPNPGSVRSIWTGDSVCSIWPLDLATGTRRSHHGTVANIWMPCPCPWPRFIDLIPKNSEFESSSLSPLHCQTGKIGMEDPINSSSAHNFRSIYKEGPGLRIYCEGKAPSSYGPLPWKERQRRLLSSLCDIMESLCVDWAPVEEKVYPLVISFVVCDRLMCRHSPIIASCFNSSNRSSTTHAVTLF